MAAEEAPRIVRASFEELQKDANDRGERGEVEEGESGRTRVPQLVLAQLRNATT